MHILATLVGVTLIFVVLLDAFQTIILPRRPTGRFRPTHLFYIVTWTPWAALACRIRNPRVREQFYSTYGPLSLVLLLVVWALILIAGFGLVFFALRTPFDDAMMVRYGPEHFALFTDLYVSGTTLFTLGLGDVVPVSPGARAIMIFESGVGLGLVALVVGYLPVLYTAFSRREIAVALLDARAGTPPTAAELLTRHGFDGGEHALIALLAEWERWSAELLESHVSYPILCFYRSQHDSQSWLGGLVTVLDSCALLIAATAQTRSSKPYNPVHGLPGRQAQLTFAMARHALVDLCHVFTLDADVKSILTREDPECDRLPPLGFRRLCGALAETEIQLCGDAHSAARLLQLRQMYEPHAQALAEYLGLSLPLWITDPLERDQWRKVASLRSPLAGTAFTAHISDHSTAASHADEHEL